MRRGSPELYLKMSAAQRRRFSSVEERRKFGRKKGCVPWNKGKKMVFTEEQWKRISAAHKGKGSWMKGKRHTEEANMKNRLAHLGKPAWNKGLRTGKPSWMSGKHHTDETRMRLSATLKARGIRPPPEHMKRLTLINTGMRRTETFRRRLSEVAHQRPPPSLEVRRKMSESHKGIPLPASTVAKMKAYRNTEEWRERAREMRARFIVPKKDTLPERAVQEYLKQQGVEYTKHQIVKELLIGTPWNNTLQFDIVLPAKKTIIEVQGCYWHACPLHYPETTQHAILKRNKDTVVRNAVEGAGWKMIWIWEHDVKTGSFKRQLDAELASSDSTKLIGGYGCPSKSG